MKYKGKTSVTFTRMMINIARSLLPLSAPLPLTLLDPVCGKGTACFCALEAGMNAMGLDIDHKAVKEAADYFSRYLKLQYLKHSVRNYSETLGKASLPVTEFVFSDSRDNCRAFLVFLARYSPPVFGHRKSRRPVFITDLRLCFFIFSRYYYSTLHTVLHCILLYCFMWYGYFFDSFTVQSINIFNPIVHFHGDLFPGLETQITQFKQCLKLGIFDIFYHCYHLSL